MDGWHRQQEEDVCSRWRSLFASVCIRMFSTCFRGDNVGMDGMGGVGGVNVGSLQDEGIVRRGEV